MLTYILLFLIRLIIIIATWGSMRDKGRCIVSTSFIWRVVSDWCCVMCFFYDIDIIMTIWCRGVWLLMRGKRSSNCSPTAFNLFTYLTLICVLAVMKCTPNTLPPICWFLICETSMWLWSPYLFSMSLYYFIWIIAACVICIDVLYGASENHAMISAGMVISIVRSITTYPSEGASSLTTRRVYIYTLKLFIYSYARSII